VRFSECLPVFEDDYAITVIDQESEPGETRFVTIGMGVKSQVLVVVIPTAEPTSVLFRLVLQSHGRGHNTRNADETTI
jgi:uncharacterized DUF497 family protein